MADKKGKKTRKNTRRWRENAFELFTKVLADQENNFAISLEELVLKNWD